MSPRGPRPRFAAPSRPRAARLRPLLRRLPPRPALLLAALLPACAPLPADTPPAVAAEGGPVVLAASSLTEALEQAGAAWAATGHPAPRFSFDASSKLAKQVEAGAPADLFLSADREWMDHLDQRGLLEPATRVDLVGNGLAVVLPAASARVVTTPGDLAQPEVRRLGLAGENVPAGRYARASLKALGAWEGVEDRVVSGDNVRTVLGWVAAGEVDAGLVYTTDARVEPGVRVALTLPAGSHPPIVYPAAVVKGAPHAREAAAFLDYCQSAEGRAIFGAAGFRPPPAAP